MGVKTYKPNELQWGHSIFVIKAANEKDRTFEGIASTPRMDVDGDILEPKGADFDLPMPLLFMHQRNMPVGEVTAANATKEGIRVKFQIFKADEDAPESLKERLEVAYHSVKMKLLRGLSVGIIPKEASKITGAGHRILKWSWLELSLVTIAANRDAMIKGASELDLVTKSSQEALSATLSADGKQIFEVDGATLSTCKMAPDSTGGRVSFNQPAIGKTKPSTFGEVMKIKDQIAGFETKRAASVARMQVLVEKAAEENATLTDEEKEEYRSLQGQVKSIDEHLVMLKEHEELLVKKAQEVPASSVAGNADDAAKAAAQARSGAAPFANPTGTAVTTTKSISGEHLPSGRIQIKSNVPQGTAFARYAIALARTKGDVLRAIEVSKQWRDSTPEVELVLKAAVDPGTTTDATWAAPLVVAQTMASEFIELMRPASIIGRIPGFRNVPFNISMPRETAGSTAGWVGQGAPKPVSELAFDTVTLGFSKVAGIVVLTQELVRFSNPSAEAVVRQDLIDCISQFTDQQFIDPSVAAVAGVSPASVTYGVTPRVSTGYTIAAITADVNAILANVSNANLNIASAVWVMNPRTALSLSMLRTTQDVFAFPGTTMQGGTFFGIPVIASNNVPLSAASGGETFIALIIASEILMADDGAVAIDASNQASLQLNTTPVAGAQSLVSLWQNNLIGLKAERYINWQKRRAQAVQLITDVMY